MKKESIAENEGSTQFIKDLSVENKHLDVQPRILSLRDVKENTKETKQSKDNTIICANVNNTTDKRNSKANTNNTNTHANGNSNIKNSRNTDSQLQIQSNSEEPTQAKTQTTSITHQKRDVHLVITEKSPNLFRNQKSPFTINEFGLEGNSKGFQANFIFFGLDESNSKEYSYDVVMSIGAENQVPAELFYILYENTSKNYILKALTKQFFFANLIVPYQQIILVDHQKNYFKIGKIIISIYPRFSDESIELIIKKSETISEKQKKTFTKGKFPVTIGRANCSVNLSCDSLSKCHSSIDYDKINSRFFFIDNSSTNGSQLILNKGKNLRLSGEQSFSINDRLFSIRENLES